MHDLVKSGPMHGNIQRGSVEYYRMFVFSADDSSSILLLVSLCQFGLSTVFVVTCLVGGSQAFLQSPDPAAYFADTATVAHLVETGVCTTNVSVCYFLCQTIS